MNELHRQPDRVRVFPGPAIALVALLGPPALHAQPPLGFYGGAGVGLSRFSVDDDSYDCCYPQGVADYDDADESSSTALSLGYRVNPNLAAEFGYFDATLEWRQSLVYIPELNDVYNNFVEVDLRASHLSVAGIMPFANVWEGYARGGIAYSQGDSSQTFERASDGSLTPRIFDESGTSYFIAAGMAVSPKPAWQLRLEFQLFAVDRDLIGANGATSVVSIMFGFLVRPEGWRSASAEATDPE